MKTKLSEIEIIIVKFLNKEANYDELEKLNNWLENDENIKTFNHFVKTEYLITLSMGNYNIKNAKKTINRRLKSIEKKRKRIIILKRMTVAASILLVISFSLFKLNYKKSEAEVVKILNNTNVGSKVILTLENGNQINVEKGKKYHNSEVNSKGDKLVYTSTKETDNFEEKLSYNYLTVPRGEQFFVQLSDGTKVWLNSDSKLKYPIKFHKNKTRHVELVYGEAYFEVSPSTSHNGAPFNVLTKMQEITVLGTEFNIKAYDEDNEIATTLVEGKIMIRKGEIKKILKPNQQSKTSYDSNLIDVSQIDISQEISWKNGLFTFNEESLDEMMKVLSRWYNTKIRFESEKQKKFVFTGKLERTKSIENILKIIEATSEGEIKFEINNKTITIK